jgi:hypothetical protein
MPVVPENLVHPDSRDEENQSIMRRDACHPPSVWNVRCQPVQVAASARSREPVSSALAQYCPEMCIAPSTGSWERPCVTGMDDLALARAARFVARRSA